METSTELTYQSHRYGLNHALWVLMFHHLYIICIIIMSNT